MGIARGSPRRRPIRLAIVSDSELVVAVVETMLSAHSDRVVVVLLPAQGSTSTRVDVVLWDFSARSVGDGSHVRTLTGLGAALIDSRLDCRPASDDPASTQDVSCHNIDSVKTRPVRQDA